MTALTVQEMLEALRRTLVAWDALPMGSHTPGAVERWLCKEIGPTIPPIRALLSCATKPAGEEATHCYECGHPRTNHSLHCTQQYEERAALTSPALEAEPVGEEPLLSEQDLAEIDQAWENFKAAVSVAVVVNDNQPGRTAIIEITAEPPTLPVGTKLYAGPKAIKLAHPPASQPAQAVDREAVARVLVPYWLGGFEDQSRSDPNGPWDNPPGTPNARAYEVADAILSLLGGQQ